MIANNQDDRADNSNSENPVPKVKNNEDCHKIFHQSGLLYFIVQTSSKYPYRFIAGNLKLFGVSEKLIDSNKDSILNLFYSADSHKISYYLSSLLKGSRKEIQIECRLKTSLSDFMWVELRGVLNKDPDTAEENLVLFVADITQKKVADASLKYKMSFTNSLIDSIPNPVYYKNTLGVFLGVNTAYEKILNKNKNQIIGKRIQDLVPSEEIDKYHLNDDEVIKNKKTVNIEDRILYGDNSWHDVLVSRGTFLNPNLSVGGIIGVINDITELKNNEKALKESELNYRRLTSYLPEIVLVYDHEKIIFANEMVETKLGFTPEEVIDNSVYNFIHPAYHQVVRKNIVRRETEGKVEDYKVELICKNGNTLLFFVRGAHIQFMGREGTLVVFTDITEKEKADERIRESEAQFRALWENSLDGMRLVNEEGITQLVNDSYCRMIGKTKEELIGLPYSIIYKESDQQKKHQQFLERVKNNAIEHDFKRKVELWNGKTIWFELSNSFIRIDNKPVLVLSVFKDVTALVEIEQQLALSQKMESIGLLAAGIAHEINSPMQFIGDNTTFLKDSFNNLLAYFNELEKYTIDTFTDIGDWNFINDAKLRFDIEFLLTEIPNAIEQTHTGIERVNKIIHALKDFAHPSAQEKTLADINHGIEVTAVISKNQWKYVAELETDLDPNLPFVNCLLDEINQVILNMIINASHAIQEKLGSEPSKKGLIIIETKHDEKFVEIYIKDNGIGIKTEHQNKIFDPFFTTKEVGKGTGQGLSIVHDIIIKRHNGLISMNSEYGKGTVFCIKLPI